MSYTKYPSGPKSFGTTQRSMHKIIKNPLLMKEIKVCQDQEHIPLSDLTR